MGDGRTPLLRAGLLAAALGAIPGCARPPGAGGAIEAPAPVQLFDGFEEDSIGGFWLPGDYGSGRHEPGAVVVSRTLARSGSGSVRITVQEGDIEQTGDGGQATERAELDSGRHLLLDQDTWFGFSFLIPAEFPVVENRLVIAQWKQSAVPGSPLVAQRYRGGRHFLTIREWEPPEGEQKVLALPEIAHGSWNDMVYHLRLSRGDQGLVEVWMNGVQVVSHRGPTASAAGKDWIYNKIGLYRDRWADPMTIYFDNYTVGASFEAVDPARFDRAP
jgi:hypothetical protein